MLGLMTGLKSVFIGSGWVLCETPTASESDDSFRPPEGSFGSGFLPTTMVLSQVNVNSSAFSNPTLTMFDTHGILDLLALFLSERGTRRPP